MSGGMEDGARLEHRLRDLRLAADRLASALDEFRDAAFGYPPLVLDEVNAILLDSGVKIEETKR